MIREKIYKRYRMSFNNVIIIMTKQKQVFRNFSKFIDWTDEEMPILNFKRTEKRFQLK